MSWPNESSHYLSKCKVKDHFIYDVKKKLYQRQKHMLADVFVISVNSQFLLLYEWSWICKKIKENQNRTWISRPHSLYYIHDTYLWIVGKYNCEWLLLYGFELYTYINAISLRTYIVFELRPAASGYCLIKGNFVSKFL